MTPAAALSAIYLVTRKGTAALDGSRNGLELVDSDSLSDAFSELADVALDGTGVLDMVLLQLDRATDLPSECVRTLRGRSWQLCKTAHITVFHRSMGVDNATMLMDMSFSFFALPSMSL